jgi:methionyl aminopeptidase
MIPLKTSQEIEIMAAGGAILARVIKSVLEKAEAGVTTLELDTYAEKLIRESGATPSFKMDKKYSFATCMCVNDMVVHGVPSDYQLKNGDILGVDCGVFYQGFHTDASWSIEIPSSKLQIPNKFQNPNHKKFLETGKRALELAVEKCAPGNHIGDISQVIGEVVTQAGYSPVKQLVGHGVGRNLHEDPEIPCYLRGRVENTEEIKPGMVFAVEVIYNQGKSPVVYHNDDGWTIVTRDGLPSGLFEHTVAVTENGPKVLTSMV